MTSSTDSTQTHLIKSSFWGFLRGFSVHTLIYPLEVIKIRQQCSPISENSARVALSLFKGEGFSAFYKGLAPQLLKTSLKQVWCWPMITGTPVFLQSYQLGDLPTQAITGLSIATVDAAISTPLERIKILSAYTGKVSASLKGVYKNGWQGFATHWGKLSVNWMTFLVAQKYLREQDSTQSEQPLSFLQLTGIGIQVAVIVSLVGAPFDSANTLKQAKNLNPSHLFSRNGISKLYRGWPLNALSLVVHNIASVTVIDKLSRS